MLLHGRTVIDFALGEESPGMPRRPTRSCRGSRCPSCRPRSPSPSPAPGSWVCRARTTWNGTLCRSSPEAAGRRHGPASVEPHRAAADRRPGRGRRLRAGPGHAGRADLRHRHRRRPRPDPGAAGRTSRSRRKPAPRGDRRAPQRLGLRRLPAHRDHRTARADRLARRPARRLGGAGAVPRPRRARGPPHPLRRHPGIPGACMAGPVAEAGGCYARRPARPSCAPGVRRT